MNQHWVILGLHPHHSDPTAKQQPKDLIKDRCGAQKEQLKSSAISDSFANPSGFFRFFLQKNGWPSGKHTKNYGKSPLFMGKLTIKWPCSIAAVKLPEGAVKTAEKPTSQISKVSPRLASNQQRFQEPATPASSGNWAAVRWLSRQLWGFPSLPCTGG